MKPKENFYVLKEKGKTIHIAKGIIDLGLIWSGLDQYLKTFYALISQLIHFIKDFPFLLQQIKEIIARINMLFSQFEKRI